VIGVVYDIGQRKRAEEPTMLIAHELEHRAKDALTVVLSLLRRTKADSADQLAGAMEERVRALSAPMGLLGKGQWQGAGLREIIESELESFTVSDMGDGHAMTLSGPARVGVETAPPMAIGRSTSCDGRSIAARPWSLPETCSTGTGWTRR